MTKVISVSVPDEMHEQMNHHGVVFNSGKIQELIKWHLDYKIDADLNEMYGCPQVHLSKLINNVGNQSVKLDEMRDRIVYLENALEQQRKNTRMAHENHAKSLGDENDR